MKNVTLIILGAESLTTDLLAKNNKLLSLSKLIRQGNKGQSFTDYFSVLCQSLSVPHLQQKSIAEITAFNDNFPVNEGHWLRADPVELKADLAAVYMYGNQHLTLTANQKQLLQNTIQPLLDDHHIIFHTTETNRCYLQLSQPANIRSFAPEISIGKDISDYLPQSTGQFHWQKLQTEIQMALHQLSELIKINSLWFWGEGEKLTKSLEIKSMKIFSNEPISLGLAKHCGLTTQPLPTQLDELFWDNLIEGENIIIDDRLLQPHTHEEYNNQLLAIENNFIAPLLSGLKKDKFRSVHLSVLDGYLYQFKKRNFYYIWK